MVVGRPSGWRLITGATPASAPIANAAEPAIGTIVNDLSMSQPQVQSTYGCSVRWDSSSAGRRGVTGCTAWNPRAFGRCTTGWPSTSGR